MSEFNLSEKIYKYANGAERMPDTIAREDVKEFIRLLKDELMSACDMPNCTKEDCKLLDWVLTQIDQLAGEKLI